MSKLQLADISLLRKILFPDVADWLIYAPNYAATAGDQKRICCSEEELRTREVALDQYVLFNLSGADVHSSNAVATVSTAQKKGAYQLAYLCNADGTVRWLYPNDDRSAYFLHLYSASGWRGTLLKQGLKWGHRLGLGSWMGHGVLSISSPTGKWYPSHFVPSSYSFAIFTGTKGENRKAVVAAGKGGRPEFFLKVPLTSAANQLISNEVRCLRELESTSLKYWVVPQAQAIGESVELTNVQPKNLQSKTVLSPLHFKAMREMWRNSKQQVLASSSSYQALKSALNSLDLLEDHPELDAGRVADVKRMLFDEWRDLAPNSEWRIGLAHGDFTPWNMFTTRSHLHVFDWELARHEPLGYDLFHFVLQSGCLIHRSSVSQILSKVEEVCSHRIWQTVPSCDPQQYWRYYLLRHIAYYVPRYLQQSELHEQVHWQLDLWHDLLATAKA